MAGAARDGDDGVIVDLLVEDGALYLELANLADRPALNVRCSFDAPLRDVAGRDISQLHLFRHVGFLGPRRRIRTLLNSLEGHFRVEGAGRLVIGVEYERPGGPRSATKVSHNLDLFRELLYPVTTQRAR